MPASRSHTQPPPGRIPEGASVAERRWLEEEGLGEKERRRRARVLRNRLSAQNSRNRRKTHLQQLEETVEHLRRENEILRGGGTVDSSDSSATEGTRLERRLNRFDEDEDEDDEEDVDDEDVEDNQDDYSPSRPDLSHRGRRVSGNTVATSDTVVSPASSTFSGWENEKSINQSLVEENAAFKNRIEALENIIRNMLAGQVVAATAATAAAASAAPAPAPPQPTFSINGQLVVPDLKVSSFPTTQTALPLSPTILSSPPLLLPTNNLNLTCHPAAMVTLSTSNHEADKALQRVSLMVRIGKKVEEWKMDVAIK